MNHDETPRETVLSGVPVSYGNFVRNVAWLRGSYFHEDMLKLWKVSIAQAHLGDALAPVDHDLFGMHYSSDRMSFPFQPAGPVTRSLRTVRWLPVHPAVAHERIISPGMATPIRVQRCEFDSVHIK